MLPIGNNHACVAQTRKTEAKVRLNPGLGSVVPRIGYY